jgi:hypothetical protein
MQLYVEAVGLRTIEGHDASTTHPDGRLRAGQRAVSVARDSRITVTLI